MVFEKTQVGQYVGDETTPVSGSQDIKPGDYVAVRVTGCSTGTLFGECLGKTSLVEFQNLHGAQWTQPKAHVEAAAGAR